MQLLFVRTVKVREETSLILKNQTIENQKKVFSLTGEYLGPVDRIRRPTYKLELTIK